MRPADLFHFAGSPVPERFAVALSGGPDSMALLHLMMRAFPKAQIAALTFDHGLRKNSAAEARQVARWIKDWPNVTHHILEWSGKKPETAIMEAARKARYKALVRWCLKNEIAHLCVAHHADDQAETFFFRLAKGSGLDGLGGMNVDSLWDDQEIHIMRPLLAQTKDEIVAYCNDHDIPFVTDPSNHNADYARPRLRAALAEEGLNTHRLARTMMRLRRARGALDFYAQDLFEKSVKFSQDQAVIDLELFQGAPEETRLRVLRMVFEHFGKGEKKGAYGPRLERLEDLWAQMTRPQKPISRFTLSGLLVTHEPKRKRIIIVPEK